MEILKRMATLIALFVMALILFGIFYFSRGKEKSVDNYYHIEKTIDSISIDQIKGASGKKLDVLRVKLKNDTAKYIYYKANQNYKDLLGALTKDDLIKLHFKEDYGENRYEIIQLEKGNYTLISLEESENKDKKLGYFCLFASIMTIFYYIQNDRKYWNK